MPDGQPLVWALNLLGHSLDDRVYGPELMARDCARAAQTGQRMYLYGGRNQGALVQLALNLRQRYPGVRIVGGYSPPHRPLTVEEREAVVKEINGPAPTSCGWASACPSRRSGWRRCATSLETPVLIGVGAAFDFHAGLVPQAPNWLQESGLEWAYRLAHEPRRLWRRYTRYNPRFVGAFARQLREHRRALRIRLTRPGPPAPSAATEVPGRIYGRARPHRQPPS